MKYKLQIIVILLFMSILTTKAEVILRVSHFWPSSSAINKEIFEQWKNAIETESNNEIRVEIYTSQTLTKVDQTYEGVVKGIADVGASSQGYTNGRFPLTQISELPGLANSAEQAGCILQKLFEENYISSEYKNTHLLFFFSTGPGLIHTKNKLVKKPEDLKGLRIRRPTAVVGELINSLGGASVGMPSTDIYTSLERGVIDGVTFPWEGMKTFHINDLVNYHTEIPFYSVAFFVTMNQEVYSQLPEHLKKVIDDNSGIKWARIGGKVFDKQNTVGRDQAIEKGHKIFVIKNALNNKDWSESLQKGTQNYLLRVKKRGLDADKVYNRIIQLGKICEAVND